MKEIKAFITVQKLSIVLRKLANFEGLGGASVTEIRGFGRRVPSIQLGRFADFLIEPMQYFRLEIVCLDDNVDEIVSLIRKCVRTGNPGDGKIFVSNIETAIRISTGEVGEKAV